MLKFLLTILLSLLHLLINAQEVGNEITTGITLKVTAPNVASNNGIILFGLYNSEENFNIKNAFSSKIGTITENKSEAIFENIPKGSYAIICFHDENENGKMDFDGFIPIEDFGATNNPVFLGPPQFNASKFEVKDTNLTFDIFF